MAKSSKKPARKFIRPMKAGTIDIMLAAACLSRRVRSEAVRLIKSEYFKHSEYGKQVFFEVLRVQAEKHESRVKIPYLDLLAAVEAEFEALGPDMPPEQHNDILADPDGLLHFAYKEVEPGDFTPKQAMALVRDFCVERVTHGVRDLLKTYDDTIPVDFSATMTLYQDEIARAQTVGCDDGWSTFETVEPSALATITVPFKFKVLADLLDEGLANEEILAITGVTGGGKSTLVHQLGMEAAETFQTLVPKGGRPKSVLVFSYEDPDARIAARGLACSARILVSRLDKMNDPETQLSKVHMEEDHALAKSEGLPLHEYPTEYQRYRAARKQLSLNYSWQDMTKGERGSGGVAEMVQLIRDHQAKTKLDPGLVIVDSIDIITQNWLEATKSNCDMSRELQVGIPMMVRNLRQRVGVAFGCALIITNQFAGNVLKRSAGTKMHHSEAGASKIWAKALDFHLALGTMKPSDRVCQVELTKGRRGGHDGEAALIKLDGAYGKWKDAGDMYTLTNGGIELREVADAVVQNPLKVKKQPKTKSVTWDGS